MKKNNTTESENNVVEAKKVASKTVKDSNAEVKTEEVKNNKKLAKLKKTEDAPAAATPAAPAANVVETVPVMETNGESHNEPVVTTVKKPVVAKGVVTIKEQTTRRMKKPAARKSPKATSKSPKRTQSRSKSPKKSPVSNKKSLLKKGATVKKGGKTNKPRRPYNVKPAPIDYAGIGIGPAKAKKVLMNIAFNPEEYAVRMELIKAENKPVRPKPTENKPDPEMPEQGPQVPIEKLPKHVLAVVRAAEAAHAQSLLDDYEHYVVSEMGEEEREKYDALKKKARADDNFVLRDFNTKYRKGFYDGFDAYCKENDSYAIGRIVKDKDGNERERFNQWTRAMTLVNKSCIRLSNGVRDILACFLDNIVVQYATNGIINCVAEEHSNLQLRHAVAPTDTFDERVPLDAFARTLGGYQLALTWIESCRQTRDEIRDMRKKIKKGELQGDVVAEMPAYPDPEYEENFEGYVVEICRSVRMQLANQQSSAAEKAKYHNIKISENFKKFCSILIYESILRIGAHLKEVVKLKSVKTVNESLIYHSLQQLCNICGIDFEAIKTDMTERLAKFTKYCVERRKNRKDNRTKQVPNVTAGDEEEEEEDDELGDNADDADDVVKGNGDEEEEDDADAELTHEANGIDYDDA